MKNRFLLANQDLQWSPGQVHKDGANTNNETTIMIARGAKIGQGYILSKIQWWGGGMAGWGKKLK